MKEGKEAGRGGGRRGRMHEGKRARRGGPRAVW